MAWKDKFYKKENKKTTGFTLVELVVAIAILGIIIAIALPTVNSIQAKNEKKKYVSYEESIISSAKLYIDSYGEDKFNKRDLNTQCASIKFEELKSLNLLKSYNLDRVECAGTGDDIVAYVVREESGNYKYYPTIVCKKNGEEVVYQTAYTVPTVCKNIDNNKIAQINNVPSCISNSSDARLTLTVDSDENKRIVELWYSLIDSVSSDNQGLIKKMEYTKIDDLNNLANISLSFADKIVQKEENKNYKLVLKYRYADSDYQYEVLNKTIAVNYAKPQIKVVAKKYDSNINIKNIKQYDDYKNNTWTNKNVYVTATATDACGKKIDVILPDDSFKEKVETNVIAEDQEVKIQELTFKTKYGNDKIAEKKFSVKIDKEKPLCDVTGGSDTWINKTSKPTSRTIKATCDDGKGSGCKTASFSKTYSDNIDTKTAGAKGNNIGGEVEDKAGNKSNCAANLTVRIDKDPPTCKVTGGNNTWINKTSESTSRTITAVCSDTGGSGCKKTSFSKIYSKNINTEVAGAKGDGKGGTVEDKAGNKSSCKANQTVRIDKTPPTCNVTGGSNTWINKTSETTSRTITAACSDTGGSGCKTASFSKTYSNNIDTEIAGAKGVGKGGTVEDKAGNKSSCKANQTVKIDKEPPKFVGKINMDTCDITDDHGYYKFGYTFTDDLSGISITNAYFKYCYQIKKGEGFPGNTCSNNGYGNATYNWDNANDGALSGKFLSGVSICLSRKSAVEVIKADLKICDIAGNCSTKKASYTPPKNKCDTLKPWPCAD